MEGKTSRLEFCNLLSIIVCKTTTAIFINYFFCHWLYSVGVRTLTIEKTNFQY
jgi:hypothetical protein